MYLKSEEILTSHLFLGVSTWQALYGNGCLLCMGILTKLENNYCFLQYWSSTILYDHNSLLFAIEVSVTWSIFIISYWSVNSLCDLIDLSANVCVLYALKVLIRSQSIVISCFVGVTSHCDMMQRIHEFAK